MQKRFDFVTNVLYCEIKHQLHQRKVFYWESMVVIHILPKYGEKRNEKTGSLNQQ